MVLIILSCAWAGGIILGSFFHCSYLLLFTGLVPLPLIFFKRRHWKELVIISVSIIAFFGGSMRFNQTVVPDDSSQLRFYNGSFVEITGMLNRDPDVRNNGTQAEFTAGKIKVGGKWQNISGRVLLFTSPGIEIKYGDVMSVSGYLESAPQIDDFDYRGYLANQGIYSIMRHPVLDILAQDKGNRVMSGIYSIRQNLARSLARVLPEPQASLSQGILLGLRGNIPQDLKDDFAQSGTTHILAISGQNLSIVAGILLSLGIRLFGRRRYLYIWLALSVILVYTLMTGVSPPVVRAAIMTGLFLIAEASGRQRSAATALAFAAAVMIGITPAVLWDTSFQLSFLAMTGLVLVAPGIQNFSRKTVTATLGEKGPFVSLTNAVLDSLSVTLAALLFVWPVIAYYFGIISLVAPLSSLLAVPAMTGIIVLSAVAGGFGIFILPLGQVFAWAAWLFLTYLLLVVKFFAALPVSFINMNTVSPVFIGIYYGCLAAVMLIIGNFVRIRKYVVIGWHGLLRFFLTLDKKWIGLSLLIPALLVTVIAFTLPDKKVHVEFLDIGQGDAILITQGKQQVVVDGGPNAQTIISELGKRMPFWDRNIELMVLTHPDSDHLTGLVEVIQRYTVAEVLCPDFPSDSELYRQWQQRLVENHIKMTLAQAGQHIDLGNGVAIDVINPAVPAGFAAGSDNNGVVLRLQDGKVSFLLTGDLTGAGEFALMSERADLAASVLKVAHHGSANSTTAEFLKVVRPEAAVISVGKDNRYGHPQAEALARLAAEVDPSNIFRTDENGTVEFITDGERLWVKTEK